MAAPIIVSLLLMVVIAAFFFIKAKDLPTTTEPSVPLSEITAIERTETIEEEVVDEVSVPLTPLVEAPLSVNGSDRTVVKAVKDLSLTIEPWLSKDELIRKTVLAVNLLAEGKVPNTRRPISLQVAGYSAVVHPDDENLIDTSKKRYYSDTNNSRRSDVFVNVMTAVSAERLAQYIKQWGGVLELAYNELGRKESFKARLDAALEQIISAQPLPEKVVLVRPKVFFQYQDPSLEKASDLQKWLWRLGDANQKKLQSYAKELRDSLNRQ